MDASTLRNTPLINEELVAELFGDTSDADMVEMQRELWAGIRRDLPREIEEIQEKAGEQFGEEVRRLMHRVAGYAGSGGLQRCCETLRSLEYGKLSQEEAGPALSSLGDLAEESIRTIEGRFPHLLEST